MQLSAQTLVSNAGRCTDAWLGKRVTTNKLTSYAVAAVTGMPKAPGFASADAQEEFQYGSMTKGPIIALAAPQNVGF